MCTQSSPHSRSVNSDLLGNLGQRETSGAKTFSLIKLVLAEGSAAHLHPARP